MSAPFANRLGASRSAYLRDAARSPVAWQPWSVEAFALAAALDRPVLLDIGASWCHWCHVIDAESYGNEEIAALINRLFVPVKVDRDERPDVDVRYQAAVGAITGSGGWPLTAFLTAGGDVFYGGTYFPPDDRPGMPGMRSLLPRIADTYRVNREQVSRSASSLLDALRRRHAPPPGAAPAAPEHLDALVAELRAEFDRSEGGFGWAPKFLHAGAVDFALAAGDERGDPSLLDMALRTLQSACRGGLHDQLGGGFHRYAVDRGWRIPHFEKLLGDQAEALGVLARACAVTGDPLLRDAAASTVDYMESVLAAPGGPWFFASQDADGGAGDDGDYYTWTVREVDAALPPGEAAVLKRRYGIGAVREVCHDPRRSVLHIAEELPAIARELGATDEEIARRLHSARARLRQERARRPSPAVDDTCIVAWNAQAASALFAAGAALGRTDWTARAQSLVDYLVEAAAEPVGTVAHALGRDGAVVAEGFLEDQVAVALALADACEQTGTWDYARRLEALLDATLVTFGTTATEALADRRAKEGDCALLAIPWHPVLDHAGAGANALAILALTRGADLTGAARFRERAVRLAGAFAGAARGQGRFAGTFLLALWRLQAPPLHAIVVGELGDPRTAALRRGALAPFRASRVVVTADPGGSVPLDRFPPEARAPLRVRLSRGSAAAPPTLFACAGGTCAAPVEDPVAAAALVAAFGRS